MEKNQPKYAIKRNTIAPKKIKAFELPEHFSFNYICLIQKFSDTIPLLQLILAAKAYLKDYRLYIR